MYEKTTKKQRKMFSMFTSESINILPSVLPKIHKNNNAYKYRTMITVGIILVIILVIAVVVGMTCKVMSVRIYQPPREETWHDEW